MSRLWASKFRSLTANRISARKARISTSQRPAKTFLKLPRTPGKLGQSALGTFSDSDKIQAETLNSEVREEIRIAQLLIDDPVAFEQHMAME